MIDNSDQSPDGDPDDNESSFSENAARLRDELARDRDDTRNISGTSALSYELSQALYEGESIGAFVGRIGGLDEVERVYGAKLRTELEDRIFKETTDGLGKGEEE